MNATFAHLQLNRFIAFDVETTGLIPEKDAIIEFAALLFVDGQPTERLTFLCDPGEPIPLEIEQLTGIKQAMVSGQPPFKTHTAEVLDFFGDLPLVGHNIGFDLAFLREHLRKPSGRRVKIANPLYDTASLSQTFLFFLTNHRLSTIAEYYGYSARGAHRAETDTLNCGRIFIDLIKEVLKYDLETLQTINMILDGTDDPNHLLFRNAANLQLLKKTLGSGETPKIGWVAPNNVFGKPIQLEQVNQTKAGSSPDDNLIDRYFGEAGLLAHNLDGYELRPQQTEMAQTVWNCLKNDQSAVIEAGTGVGKSLAYLVPTVLWLHHQSSEKMRLLIASNTKILQEQIFYKEIPFVADRLNLPFKAVLLKGRNNYICLTRWFRYLANLPHNLHLSYRSNILPIVIWLKHTQSGDIAECNGFRLNANRFIWNEICSEPGYCTSSICQKYGGCFLGKIRGHANTADVIVVNHSLLLADAAADNKILPEFDTLVIDEAHNLEKNSYNYFAGRINLPMLSYFLNNIHSGSVPERGVLVDATYVVQDLKRLPEIEPLRNQIIEKIATVKIIAESFFSRIALEKTGRESGRGKVYGVKKRYKVFQDEFPNYEEDVNSFQMELENLKLHLVTLKNRLESIFDEAPEEFDELQVRISNAVMNIEMYLETFRVITRSADAELIFWYEIASNGKENSVELVCTPLAIADRIHEKVLKGQRNTFLTSATLRIIDSFDYILSRSGMDQLPATQIVTKALGSPFMYDDQMKFFTFHQEREHDHEYQSLANLITRLSRETGKGMLVLFTAYQALYDVYQLCLPTFTELGITLLAQGQTGSRSALLEQFRIEKNSVLFGTDSFWEGIDVIGSALEILIIAKLPFPVPSEPIIEANVEKIKVQGGDPFNQYYVPEAVLKFRQGVGRLIRSITDIGVVINCDERVDKRLYGKYFKQSLPVEPISVFDEDELVESVQRFFRKGR